MKAFRKQMRFQLRDLLNHLSKNLTGSFVADQVGDISGPKHGHCLVYVFIGAVSLVDTVEWPLLPLTTKVGIHKFKACGQDYGHAIAFLDTVGLQCLGTSLALSQIRAQVQCCSFSFRSTNVMPVVSSS